MSIISHLWGQGYYKQKLSTCSQSWAGLAALMGVEEREHTGERPFRDKAKLNLEQRKICLVFPNLLGRRGVFQPGSWAWLLFHFERISSQVDRASRSLSNLGSLRNWKIIVLEQRLRVCCWNSSCNMRGNLSKYVKYFSN